MATNSGNSHILGSRVTINQQPQTLIEVFRVEKLGFRVRTENVGFVNNGHLPS